MNVYILIGVPGSGKSTLAKRIAKDQDAVICSADDYFMLGGTYRFDASKLGNAHQSCKAKAQDALMAGKDIVIDNTNTRKSEIQPYVDMAEKYGAKVCYIQPSTAWRYDAEECCRRGTHNVPLKKTQEMLDRIKILKTQVEIRDYDGVKKVLD